VRKHDTDLVFHERICHWNIDNQRRRDIVAVFIRLAANNHLTTAAVQQRLHTSANTNNTSTTYCRRAVVHWCSKKLSVQTGCNLSIPTDRKSTEYQLMRSNYIKTAKTPNTSPRSAYYNHVLHMWQVSLQLSFQAVHWLWY